LPARLVSALDGLDWELRQGTKHWRVMVGGEQVMVISHAAWDRHDFGSTRQALSTIRRFRRSHEGVRT
jgi:hypothetical protein